MPKSPPFRSDRLRRLAEFAPHCMGCLEIKPGMVVLAHSNRICDGKGMGTKAHDIPCYVCDECHTKIDLEGNEELRLEATYRSMVWLLKDGYVEVK